MQSIINNKPYEWGTLQKYPEKYYANMDYDRSPATFYVGQCFKWPDDLPKILDNAWSQTIDPPYIYYYYVKGDKEGLLNYDYISNISGAPVVNKRIRQLLEELCPHDVQFIDAEIQTKNGLIKDEYYVLNILNKVDAIDMEETDYWVDEDGDINFDKIYFKENCMGVHHIACEMQYTPIILVSEELKKLFKKYKIKGPVFWTDLEAYCLSDPSHEKIIKYYTESFSYALRSFKNALESYSGFFMFRRKLDRYPTEMLETLISKVEGLNERGQKNLQELRKLVEERKQKNVLGA
ncbi:MAG: DUF1629 domain-containing protein [Alphaproteobacteria bacterium]|nr:DUF1629 domain-containing protein [Alphaproteobacteria bacterium]